MTNSEIKKGALSDAKLGKNILEGQMRVVIEFNSGYVFTTPDMLDHEAEDIIDKAILNTVGHRRIRKEIFDAHNQQWRRVSEIDTTYLKGDGDGHQ